MNRLLIDYWREWRPEILRWIAAILIFALFAWVIVDYFDFFQFLFEPGILCLRLDFSHTLSCNFFVLNCSVGFNL